MSFAIINLLSNVFMTGFSFIGICTTINKIGKFFKVIDENKGNGFKTGFDVIMLDSIEEMNRCIESVSIITNNCNKIFFIIYDISVGNKYIKKDKEGKIIICNKSKIFSGYKDKIEELNCKVKKYQQELNKINKIKKKNNNNLSTEKSKKSKDKSLEGGSSVDGSSESSNDESSRSSDDESSDDESADGSADSNLNENEDNETYSEVSSNDVSFNNEEKDNEFYLES